MKLLKIQNRRYIGSKTSFLKIIDNIVDKYYPDYTSFADVFAGTGVVAKYFLDKDKKIFVNDFLYSNYIAYDAWMGNMKINRSKIEKIIAKYNSLDAKRLKSNYFSKIYGKKYFSVNTAKKIGNIRELIEKNKQINSREKNILLSSLMYEADRVANTVGHFEHYLKSNNKEKVFLLKNLKIDSNEGEVRIFSEDVNGLVKKIKSDIIYLDPPYNARQYINFYHVLENLARWEKPTEFEGKSMKFKREHLKSDYSKVKARDVFEDLVRNINAKLIILSYNNTYNAKSTASNNKIRKEDIISILKSKGRVTVEEVDYKFFNSGKTNFKNHKEYLYICEVKR